MFLLEVYELNTDYFYSIKWMFHIQWATDLHSWHPKNKTFIKIQDQVNMIQY